MKMALWRGRLFLLAWAMLMVFCGAGCNGLSDRQMASILQSTITTALTTLVQVILARAAGLDLTGTQ